MEDNHHFHEALRAYREVARLIDQKIKSKESISSDLVRHAGMVLALLLRAYALPENWKGSTSVSPLPPDIAADIARNLQIVCGGHIPRWMLHLQKRGTTPADPRILEWQGYAAAFVKLCKDGTISHAAPTKFVADHYGVDRKAVQLWVQKLNPDPNYFFPQAESDGERARLITAKVLECGIQYREWGPGPKNPRPFGKGRKRPRAK